MCYDHRQSGENSRPTIVRGATWTIERDDETRFKPSSPRVSISSVRTEHCSLAKSSKSILAAAKIIKTLDEPVRTRFCRSNFDTVRTCRDFFYFPSLPLLFLAQTVVLLNFSVESDFFLNHTLFINDKTHRHSIFRLKYNNRLQPAVLFGYRLTH